jgi:hypothetical protein
VTHERQGHFLARCARRTADSVTPGDHHFAFPPRVIVDFSPDAVAVISIMGTTDDDSLARQIIQTMRTTKDPQCYFPLLDATLKATDDGFLRSK